jgi:ubiquinone/menaquinone biosynthesis C-methylase UbiE
MDYDKTTIPDAYNRGRDHGPAVLDLWMNVVAARTGAEKIRYVLDLGCGTGRFSSGLARRFGATVIGIDPSTKMLRQAMNASDVSVVCANGTAEALPLPEKAVDLIFISMAFHHFSDPGAAAGECRRVLRDGGRVCLRTASAEQIPQYAYVPFFPASRRLLEERIPPLKDQQRVFEAASFELAYCELVSQEIAPDYSIYADKLATKSDSILASLDDRDLEEGLRAIRAYAAATPPHPVIEPIDFIVLEKKKGSR